MDSELLNLVKNILDEVDAEGFIKMGAPKGHYEPEARTLVARIESGKPITPEYVRDVWLYWFGCGERQDDKVVVVRDIPMRPSFARIAELIQERIKDRL